MWMPPVCADRTTNQKIHGYDFPSTATTAPKFVATNTPGVKTPDVIAVETAEGTLKINGVPRGASGTPVATGKGLEYPIPPGTPELSPNVASVRVMDPVTSGKYQYPDGYVVYMKKSGQAINPLTGQTVSNADPMAHIPLKK